MAKDEDPLEDEEEEELILRGRRGRGLTTGEGVVAPPPHRDLSS